MDKERKSNIDSPATKKMNMSEPNKGTYDPGPDWTLDWSDEFNDSVIDKTNWRFQVEEAGRFNEEWQRYTNSDKNAYIQDDCLVIKAIHESDSHGLDQYTSARLNTAGKRSWKYGKIAASIKLPYGQGIWPAFWMLGVNIDENGGDTPWPHCGEIDIFELYGTKDDAVVEANIHYADQSGSHDQMGAVPYHLEKGRFADDFHVFELEWNAQKVTWSVDGKQYASFSIEADDLSEFHNEFFLLLNIAVGGTYADYPNDTSTFPQFMYIDWVRVYKQVK
jgi:beta-glucanase (GH16 family)